MWGLFQTRKDLPWPGATLTVMTEFFQVTTATDTRETAVTLARSVTKARLAAGAEVVGPVVSMFWHQGSYGEGEEWHAAFKTTADRYPELEKHLVDNHPWQNPEVTAVRLAAGSAPYLEWVRTTTNRETG
jgi:periplasmic divalent cation tolerance protein